MVLPLIACSVVAAVNLIVIALVMHRNQRNATHRLLGLFALVSLAWTAGSYVLVTTTTSTVALWSVKAIMAFTIVQSVLFALLAHTFPRSNLAITRPTRIAVMGIAILGLIVALSAPQSGVPGVLRSWAPPIFIAINLGLVAWGIIALIKNNLTSVSLQRVQQRYFLLGVLITLGLAAALLVSVDLTGREISVIPYAQLLMVPFVIMTTYALLQHRLIAIRATVAYGVSWAMMIGAFVVVYGALVIVAVPILTDQLGVSASLLTASSALVAVVLARYIQQTLERLTDRFLFQQQAEYRTALVMTSQKLSRSINSTAVTSIVLQTMRETVGASSIAIFIKEPNGDSFVPQHREGSERGYSTLRSDNVLVRYAGRAEGPIILHELRHAIIQDRRVIHRAELEQVKDAFVWLNIEVALPLFVDQELTGLILLGGKQSGDVYLQNDAHFLAAFAPQAATALANARLYQESLAFGAQLKEEVQHATHELAVANRQLMDLDKAKSEFLGIASHQLYTPLTAIRGYLSMLQEGDFGELKTKQQPVVTILDKSAIRLIDLIKNLLDISRIESGRLELNLESVDTIAMAKELVQDLMPNAMHKQLKLEWHQPAHAVPAVVADRQRLRQVMLNFIDNAIKYTEHGTIDVTVQQLGDTIEFAVADTGKGLAPEEITKLFTKFTRVGGAAKHHTEGTGLGLYVAQQIVREHRGEVNARSHGRGQGSTFSMIIPVQGSPRSLKLGDKATVVIKAAEAVGAVAPTAKYL